MLLNASLVLMLSGLAVAIGGAGWGVYLVLAGIVALGGWFVSLLL